MTSFRERIRNSSREKQSKIVLALDFSGPVDSRIIRAKRVLQITKGSIAAVKVNHHLILPFGLEGLTEIIDTCRNEDLPLIADLKLNDIEATNLNVVESLFERGFDAVIANPFVGYEDGLGKAIERIHALAGGILLLVYMSHRGAMEGYGLRLEGGEYLYTLFAKRARDWGADGVIVSAKSRDMMENTRAIVGKECLIFSPGVGAQGGAPVDVSASIADFLIVGRTIVDSPEPRDVVKGLNSN
ncbi:MAG: orotidine 5'-phosphate decarboxylase [Thaumarchaeota archaeon]|nr:orotidine 5'-phosphate decarboxylase [Nitrososphaerota archaeon]